jgi:hypothetical protein
MEGRIIDRDVNRSNDDDDDEENKNNLFKRNKKTVERNLSRSGRQMQKVERG